MALLYCKFQFCSFPQLLPPLPQLTEIWDMLTISNYCNPLPPISDFNLKYETLFYLTPMQFGS